MAAPRGDGEDRVARRAELQRRLNALSPRARLESMLDAADARELVRSASAEDLYLAIADVGLADAAEVVQLASPTQFQTFVDLAAWRRDRLDAHELLSWLRTARGEDPEDLLAKLHGMDLELLEMLLRSCTEIHDLEEDPDVNPEGETMESAERRYLIEFKVEGVEQATLRSVLNDWMAESPFEFSRLLEAVRWELPTELEETAYRFRSARLEDLGFPDLDRALSLYAAVPLPDRGVAAPDAGVQLVASDGDRGNLLQAALRQLEPVEQENFESELRAVVNAVLVAEAADPGDLEAVRRAGERARDTLMLGLELTSGGDVRRLGEIVRTHSARKLFQLGFSLALRLQHRANRLLRTPLSQIDGVLLLWPDAAAMVEAVRRKRPLRAGPAPLFEPVPFRSLREIDAADALLTRAEAQRAIFSALLGGTEPAARAALATLGAAWPVGGVLPILTSALGHALLDGTPRVAPVERARLPALAAAFLEGTPEAPQVRSAARDRLTEVLSGLTPGTGDVSAELVDPALEALRETLGPALLRGEPPPLGSEMVLPVTDTL